MPCLKNEIIMTACDYCNTISISSCSFKNLNINMKKNLCSRLRFFELGKKKANERALALYERELRQFKRLLNEVSSDKMGGKLISVRDSLADFEKALEDDK